MKKITKILTLISLAATFPSLAQEQPVKQEVKVVKAYEPVINDAFKISELPKINDTLKISTSFQYEILPVQHKTSFVPVPIKPARLVSEPLSKHFYGYAKAGFGSYISPLFQVYAGSNRSENWNWNTYFNYNSTNGKVKNEANEKVYAGLSDLSFSADGSRFLKNSKVLNGSASYKNLINYYYGYNPESVAENNIQAPLLKDSIENQVINLFNANLGISTNYIDSSHVNYQIDANWQTLSAKDGIDENYMKIKTRFNYFFEKEFIGADIDLIYIANHGLQDTTNAAIFKFSPWVGAFGKKWRIVAGVNTFFDQANEKYHFYPKISMHYNIIEYFLIPYLEFDGSFQENSYADIYKMNPFVRQTLSVKPLDTKINLTFGFRGNISSKVAFNIKVNYAEISNQYFFVTDISTNLQNKLETVTDQITRFRFLGELSYKTNEKLWLSLKANYYEYQMESQLKPWHMPNYNLSFNIRYKLQQKIIFDANLYGIGARYAREFDQNSMPVAKELPGIIDLNLGVEYRFSKRLSAFANFNNISAVKYYQWNNYPTQQFNLMAGATYSF